MSATASPAPLPLELQRLQFDDFDYCACFCEENIYRLLQKLTLYTQPGSNSDESASQVVLTERFDFFAVFVSNEARQVPIFAGRPNSGVVWDYHCFAVAKAKAKAKGEAEAADDVAVTSCDAAVFDFDLNYDQREPRKSIQRKKQLIIAAADFARSALICGSPVPSFRERRYRIVPARHLLASFCSDRSHMRKKRARAHNDDDFRERHDGRNHGSDGSGFGEEYEWIMPPPAWEAICSCSQADCGGSTLWSRYLDMKLTKDSKVERDITDHHVDTSANICAERTAMFGTVLDEHDFLVWLLDGPASVTAETTFCPSPPLLSLKEKEATSLVEWALQVLRTSDVDVKCALTRRAVALWQRGRLVVGTIGNSRQTPEVSARPDNIAVLSQREMPRRRGAGSVEGRIDLIHSLVFIESMALDLTWDIIARFVGDNLPRQFYDDFVKIADDEQRHFTLLRQRLEALGSYFGARPGHDGLWESATTTKDSCVARLAIEHIVHEGHGLDTTPKSIARLASAGDKESAEVLDEILQDEVTHVTSGVKWFSYLVRRDAFDPAQVQCERNSSNSSGRLTDPIRAFHALVPLYFRGQIRPPFAHELRAEAGMTPEWYEFQCRESVQ